MCRVVAPSRVRIWAQRFWIDMPFQTPAPSTKRGARQKSTDGKMRGAWHVALLIAASFCLCMIGRVGSILRSFSSHALRVVSVFATRRSSIMSHWITGED